MSLEKEAEQFINNKVKDCKEDIKLIIQELKKALDKLEKMLSPNLFGKNMSIADLAILPFVRQFAHIDDVWFYAQDWLNLINWLDNFKQSSEFNKIMTKLAPWQLGDTPVMLSDLYSLK